MSVELPCRLGPYLLLRHLASGGMGDVYLAHEDHQGTPRLCVVKTVRGDYAGDRVATRRFVDEARTSSLLRHKNVVAVYDVGDADGTAYIAVEYVAGRDLFALFVAARRAGHTLPEAVSLHITAELLDALAYVHQATDPRTGAPLRVVHRDVSPQNVLVGFDGCVKLIDFGIARSAVREELTRVGQLVGKLRYVSPEQARGERVDGATDVWAACVTATELLTGQRFWGERRPEAVAPLLAAGVPVEPAGFSNLDRDLQEALRAGLEPDPSRRPSAAELREVLRALAHQRGLRDPEQQTRALLVQLFAGEEARELQARTALLHEPTVVRAAAMPDSALFEGSFEEIEAVEDEGLSASEARGSRTDPLTVGMRPFALPDTRVLEPTPQSVPVPAAPSASQRRPRPRRGPSLVHLAAAGAGLVVVAALALWASPPAPDPMPPALPADPPAVLASAAPRAGDPAPPLPLDASPATVPAPAPADAVVADALAGADAGVEAEAPTSSRPRKATRPRKAEAKPRLFGDRVRALRECAPRPACASSVLRRAEDVTALSVTELRELDEALERCLQRCR